MNRYDYLIVGAGLFGATVARRLKDEGARVLVIDKREHIAGNCYTENDNGIMVHKYGAHIFHTNDDEVWEFVNRFATFNDYVHMVKADYKGEMFSLPFNMNTFREMWGVETSEEACKIIEEQKVAERITVPRNLEEQAISMVGRDIYEKLVKGYTEKQWGKSCAELPSFIIRRLPLRMEFNNEYFNAKYQGIPVDGYTKLVEEMLKGIEVELSVDFLEHKTTYEELADKIVYTGQVDSLLDYKFGELEYRSIRFENERIEEADYQGCAVVNYTDEKTPWTRIIEHKWFCPKTAEEIPNTIISREYSQNWTKGAEPFYPINDEKNNALYARYKAELAKNPKYVLGGRLGDYKYYDMDAAIARAFSVVAELCANEGELLA